MATPAAGAVGLGEWSVPTGSQFVVVQDSFSGEEPFMRISIGTFIGQRTEALGALGEEGDTERPHFGRTIVTPPSNRLPVALIRLSEVSQDQGPKLVELLEDGAGDAGKGAGDAGIGPHEGEDLDSTIRFSGVGDYAPEQDDSLYLHDQTLTPGYHPEEETPYPERARPKPHIKLVNDDTIVIETTQEALGRTQDLSSDTPRARHAAEKTTSVPHVPKTKDGAERKRHQAKSDHAEPAVEQKRTQQGKKDVSSQQKLQGTKPADDKAKDDNRSTKTEPDSSTHSSVAVPNKDLTADDISISDKTMDASCAGPNISSIASAIVNASVSDDPTKLADMILKLSEKTSKGRDRRKAPKQASGKPAGLVENKVPGSQVPKEQKGVYGENRPVKGSVDRAGSSDRRPPAKHLPISNVNKAMDNREKDTAKVLPTRKQPDVAGLPDDKRNESVTAASDTSKLGSPTKHRSRIPVKQGSKTKSPTKVSFLDRSENADNGVGNRVPQKLDIPYSVDKSFGTAGKKDNRSYNLERGQEFEGSGQPSVQKSSTTDVPDVSDSVQGIPRDGKHSRKADIPGRDSSTKEFSQTRDSRLKVDHSSRPKMQDDSVNSGTVKDKWETMEPLLRTRDHSPCRKAGTQSAAKDRPPRSGQESFSQNNLSFSINSNYDVDIKYNFDVGKEDVTVEGWPSRSKDKTSGSRTLFRERSPIRDRSPRRSVSPGFDTTKEHGKRDSHHGKSARRAHSPQRDFHGTHSRPDRDSNLQHDHRKSSNEASQKQKMPSDVRQSSSSSSRTKTNGLDFDTAAQTSKPKKAVKLHKCILPGIEIEPEPTVPRKIEASQQQIQKSSPKAGADKPRMKDTSKVKPSAQKTQADGVPQKESRRTMKDFDVSMNLPPGVATSNEDNILSPKAEDLELHLKMANLRTRGDKTSPARSTSFGAPLSPTRPPVSPPRDSIASVHSTIQPSASSTPQSPSSPGKTRSRIEMSQTFGDSTTFNFSPDNSVSSLSPTLSHVSPTPGRAEASVLSVQDTPGETLLMRLSGATLSENPSVTGAPSPGRPMITPFQAYPQTSAVAATTTPTLLTSRSLFTNPVAVQYLQSRPVSGMGGHTTTVAASGMQQPYTYPPQPAPPYPGMYPPTSSLHPAYPPGIQQYQPYAEGMAASAYPPTTHYQAHPGVRLPYGVVPPVAMGIPGPPPSSLHGGMPTTVPGGSMASNVNEDPQQGMMTHQLAPSRTSGSRASTTSTEDVSYMVISPGSRASTTPTEDVSYRVISPGEVRFPGVCCVGIGIQALLPLHNPTSRWLQCALQVLSINANGEHQMMPAADNIFHLKQKTIIGPHTTEEIKVLFTPHHPGVYVAQVQVSSCLVLANSEDAAVIDHMPSIVNVQAIAEKPFIQVTTGESDALNFGDLPGSSTVCLPIKLTNHTRASVPVRLILSSTSAMWHCFSFKDNRRESGSSTSVYHCTLQGKSDQQLPDPAIVMVQFRAPEKQLNTSGSLGPPEEYTGRVDIEMDTPGTTSVIASVPMKARVGVARIHTPRTLQALVLTTSIGTSISRSVPLKNAGNIPVTVDLTVTKEQDVFTLLPSTLTLHPGQQSEVTVKFAPKHAPHTVSSLMTMCVRPGGPQYEVLLRGECVMMEKKPQGVPAAADAPPVLSNKQFLSWGGVPMGRALQQKLVLRNSSQTQTLKLDLTIRDDGNGCFQLQSSFMEHEQLSSSRQIILKPLEDFPVHLIFAPTRVATMQAKLVIKPPKGNTKFTIPLSGYGGTCNLTVEGLRAVSDMYIANLGEVSVGKKSTIDIPVRNTGSRAAFVKAMCFGDLSARTQLPANRVRVEPSEFVLRERTTKVISVVFHISEKEEAICAERADTIGTLGLFYGDEISRKQLRRALRKGSSERGLLADTNPLKGVNFDMQYLGEEHAQEVYDLPERPNDIRLFYSCMSRVMVSLVGRPPSSNTEERRRTSSVDSSVVERMAVQRRPPEPQQKLTNSPPVKGTPISKAFVTDKPKKDEAEQAELSSKSWSVQPEQLMLLAPGTGGDLDAAQVQVLNHTDRVMSFELSWPGHCLTVTPQHGKVDARSHQVILVSPNPATQGKPDIFPWRGNLFIHCDNGQKIREDLALEKSTYTSAQLQPLVNQDATPNVTPAAGLHKDKSSPTAEVSVASKVLKFPPTRKGETAESCLDFRNASEKEMKWELTSFAPAYVKGVDDTNDIFRATYTVFRFARISGTLGATERIQIPVTFIPREIGSYSQFWDLQTELRGLSGGPAHTTRIQLIAQGKECMDTTDDSLPRNQQRSRKISGNNLSTTTARNGGSDSAKSSLVVPCDRYVFPVTVVDQSSTEKVLIKNDSATPVSVKFVSPRSPFKVNHHKYTLKGKYYVQLPVHFKPTQPGKYESLLVIQSELKGSFAVQLVGEATRGKYYVQLPVHFKPTQPGKYESLLVIQSELKGSFAVQLVGEATRSCQPLSQCNVCGM
uniref:Abnormal spindle-like microcephaly-associated protein ASH domain-containing protein n=1 Tax=Branchiostoma floridae TaxID=7739 RepID=C3ZBA9_BRAFL|eukprot:XP_002594135.1 hypothetical protein BRAFLDRAFT_68423 [Branchiostoma floridae]